MFSELVLMKGTVRGSFDSHSESHLWTRAQHVPPFTDVPFTTRYVCWLIPPLCFRPAHLTPSCDIPKRPINHHREPVLQPAFLVIILAVGAERRRSLGASFGARRLRLIPIGDRIGHVGATPAVTLHGRLGSAGTGRLSSEVNWFARVQPADYTEQLVDLAELAI